MPATVITDLTWFPLVPRPRSPAADLEARIGELTSLAARTGEGTRQEPATRASAVLNKAALVASDCGVPVLARELCHRQYDILARAAPLPAWAAKLAMQPVLNVARQLIRDGHADDAHAMLEALHQAALNRTATAVHGMSIDFGTLTSTADGHKEACILTWTALLADGTRALAQAGRWNEAAERAAAHRGTGDRLLDGRQAAILALLTNGQAAQANQMTEQATVTEPWEQAVQAVLHALCQRGTGQYPEPAVTRMIATAQELAEEHDPATAVTRTRIGLIALDLAGGSNHAGTRAIRRALITAGSTDAHAARDLLASHQLSKSLTSDQRAGLHALVRACGLGTGTIPMHLHDQLTRAARRAETALQLSLSCATA